jgi:hypothetical protein
MYFDNSAGRRKLLHIQNQSVSYVEFESLFSSDPKCDGNDIFNKKPIPSSHSSAFVDIDADCHNDLLITSIEPRSSKRNLEIWRGIIEKEKIKYCLTLSSVYKLDDALGHYTVADINRDGMLDLIFPILDSSKVLIAFNKFNLEFVWSEDFCESVDQNNTTLSIKVVYDEITLNPPSGSVRNIIITI